MASTRIPLPRLVVGILLHFCVPAYLIACLVAAFAVDPPVTRWADILPRMGWTGAWFVPAFLLLLLAGAIIGRVVESRIPPPLPDGATVARAQLGEGRRVLAAIGDRRIGATVSRLDAVAWSLDDPADQQVAADLAAAARTFEVALASATPARRADVLTLAADSLAGLADAAEALAADRARLDEGDARTVAGYIAARYR